MTTPVGMPDDAARFAAPDPAPASPNAAAPAFVGFEGSYLGHAARLPADARLECKICWWVYDPALGDPVWQIAPGTPFVQLPPHWRCPQCDGEAAQFMVLASDDTNASSMG